jgi:DNA-binding CsgD family transcriptional regulator
MFRTGRGQFRIGARNRQAHRVAWELTFGSSPHGLLRSKCGNLQCVRPDHQVVVDRKVGARNLARTPVKRFEAMVHKGPDCWLWVGSCVDGYGQFGLQDEGKGRRMIPAHRFAWESAFGAIPGGADVLHSCENRACVRPDHLLLWDPVEALRLPTRRQLDVLRMWVGSDMRYGSYQRVARDLGLQPQSVASYMWAMRKRLGVTSTREAVAWLEEHQPHWRTRGDSGRDGCGPLPRPNEATAPRDGTPGCHGVR